MSKRGLISIFLLLPLMCFSIVGSTAATPPTETSSAAPSPADASQNATPRKKLSSKKQKSRASKKTKEDFWTHCQKMKGSLFKEDLDDSVYPKEPLIQAMPGVKPMVIPCKFEPDTKSLPGGRAKCSF